MTSNWLVKVMQTGVEIVMTEDQPSVISSDWDSGGGAVSWQTKKQQTVALSSCEAEYECLTAAVQEATFFRSLMCDIGYQQMQATVIGEDSQSCIKLATNPVMHKTIQAYRYEISLHTKKSWWQPCSTGLHANRSTGRSVDEITSTSESGGLSKATLQSIADCSSRQRNNMSGGVEGKNLVNFLELKNSNFYVIKLKIEKKYTNLML